MNELVQLRRPVPPTTPVFGEDIPKAGLASKTTPGARTLEDLLGPDRIFYSMDEAVDFSSQYEAMQQSGVSPQAFTNALKEHAGLGYVQQRKMEGIHQRVRRRRSDIIKAVEDVGHYYMCQVIIEQVAEDALMPDVTTNDVVRVSSEEKEVQEEIELLNEKFDFNNIIHDTKHDLLKYGEYTLGLETEQGKGILDITDDVDQTDVVAIPKHGRVESYLVRGPRGGVEIKGAGEYVKFVLGIGRIRVDVHQDFGLYRPTSQTKRQVSNKVPRYIRMGKPFILSIVDKIKELDLLENLVPAAKIAKLASGNIVGLMVPENTSPKDALEACRVVEGHINQKIGIDRNTGLMSAENVIASSGRIKVVPIYGDKGDLKRMDYKPEEPDEMLAAIKDIRMTICSSVGVPYEILFESEVQNKGEILKRYARYMKKLKAVQKSFAQGIKDIVIIHCQNKNVQVSSNKIKISFYNKLVQIDILDELEYLAHTIGLIKDIEEFLFGNARIAQFANLQAFLEMVQKKFSLFGLDSIVDAAKAKGLMYKPAGGDAAGNGDGSGDGGSADAPGTWVPSNEPQKGQENPGQQRRSTDQKTPPPAKPITS